MTSTSAVLLIGQVTVRAPEKWARYTQEVLPLVHRHGGGLLGFAAADAEPVEGEWTPDFLFVQRWPSRAAFSAFYDDPEYQPLKRLRHEGAETRMTLISELPSACAYGRSDRHR